MKQAQEGHVPSLSLPAVSQWHQSRNREKEALKSFFGVRGVPLDIDKVFKGRQMGFEASYDLAGCFT